MGWSEFGENCLEIVTYLVVFRRHNSNFDWLPRSIWEGRLPLGDWAEILFDARGEFTQWYLWYWFTQCWSRRSQLPQQPTTQFGESDKYGRSCLHGVVAMVVVVHQELEWFFFFCYFGVKLAKSCHWTTHHSDVPHSMLFGNQECLKSFVKILQLCPSIIFDLDGEDCCQEDEGKSMFMEI